MRGSVLIVEDEADIRRGLALDLRHGARLATLEAEDRPQALALLESGLSPSLVLTDLMMPSGLAAGLELISDLKADPRWRRIPVVVLSARGEADTILEALRRGAVDYLVKPYDPAEVAARVDRALALAPAGEEGPNPEARLRRLLVECMRLAVMAWELNTQRTKVELAEESGLWTPYLDAKGTYSTKTLDKYLAETTLPSRPKNMLVLQTGHFVLGRCPSANHLTEQLAGALEVLTEALRNPDSAP